MKQKQRESFIRECIGWDTVNWSDVIALWENYLMGKEKLKVLDIGTGSGGLSLWMAEKGHTVHCTDLHDPRSAVEPKMSRYELQGKVVYEAMDALHIPYTDEFDVVIFKSVMGGVSRNGQDGNRLLMARQIYKTLKPGGALLFAENLRASLVHRFLRRHFVKWGETWNYPTISEMNEALRSFRRLKTKTTGVTGTFGRSEKQRRILGYIDRAFWNHILPANCQYIMYGVAMKD